MPSPLYRNHGRLPEPRYRPPERCAARGHRNDVCARSKRVGLRLPWRVVFSGYRRIFPSAWLRFQYPRSRQRFLSATDKPYRWRRNSGCHRFVLDQDVHRYRSGRLRPVGLPAGPTNLIVAVSPTAASGQVLRGSVDRPRACSNIFNADGFVRSGIVRSDLDLAVSAVLGRRRLCAGGGHQQSKGQQARPSANTDREGRSARGQSLFAFFVLIWCLLLVARPGQAGTSSWFLVGSGAAAPSTGPPGAGAGDVIHAGSVVVSEWHLLALMPSSRLALDSCFRRNDVLSEERRSAGRPWVTAGWISTLPCRGSVLLRYVNVCSITETLPERTDF